MVHRREINGQEIVLGNQGDLWDDALTLYDHETGSIWSQPLGEAILGPLKGETMELLPSQLTTWRAWKNEHLESFALDAPTGTSDVDIDELVIVVELGDVAAAFPIPEIRAAGVINTEVDGVAIAVAVDPDTNSWAAFFRQANNRTVRLELVENEAGDRVLAEVGRNFRWSPSSGLSLTPLAGATDEARAKQHLEPFPASTSFLEDYYRFHPDGLVWDGETLEPVSP